MSRALCSRRISIDLFHLRQRIGELVCSSPWLEVSWEAVCCGGPHAAQKPERFLAKNAIYPPGGPRESQMRRCTECGGRWYPPQYVAGTARVCLDCRAAHGLPLTDETNHVSSTSSPTAIALERLEALRVRLIETRLPAEDEASLRREISDFKRRSAPSNTTKRHFCESAAQMT